MPGLRELLTGLGYGDVRTYLASGNVVLTSRLSPKRLAAKLEREIADELGLETDVLLRTREELAEVLARDPLRRVAREDSKALVTFLATPLAADAVRALEQAAGPDERIVARGREVYSWHPAGVGRSELAKLLTPARLGVPATARNRRTVAGLVRLAGD